MIPYLILVSIIMPFTVMYDKTKKNIYFIIASLITLTFSFLRSSGIGTDNLNYYRWYNQLSINDTHRVEVGFEYLGRWSSNLGLSFHSFLIICSAIIIIPMLLVIKKKGKNKTSIIMFIFLATQYVKSFSVLRGYISFSLLMVAYFLIQDSSIKKRNKILKYLLILLAFLFHKSTLLFVLLLEISKKRYSMLTYFMITSISFLISVSSLGKQFVSYAMTWSLFESYEVYNNLLYGEKNFSLVYILIYSLFFLISLSRYKSLIKIDSANIVLINMGYFMLIFSLFFYWIPVINRVTLQNLFLIAILSGHIDKSMDLKSKLLFNYTVVIVFITFFLLNFSSNIYTMEFI